MSGRDLRCMARGQDGDWEAICVDLDIAAQGTSFEEVRDSLHEAIDMYLERIAELPEEEQRQVLSHRSPWYVRAQFVVLSCIMRDRENSGTRRRSFTLQSHAPA